MGADRRSELVDPIALFVTSHRASLPAARRGGKRFNGGEHIWLGDHGAAQGCKLLEAQHGIDVSYEDVFNGIHRRRTPEALRYGELVALSGDFYETPEELWDERPSPVPWLWEGNDVSDLQAILAKEVAWINENRVHDQRYPDYDIRLAWNAKLYVELALRNVDHFGWHNIRAYVKYHAIALDLAREARGRNDETFRKALHWNAFADHFLTDGFAAGHMRVPRAEIIDWAAARGWARERSGALSKLIHDQDGHVGTLHGAADEATRGATDGLHVRNARGDEWYTRCDGQLFMDGCAVGSPRVDLPVEAVSRSVLELLVAWKRGDLPAGLYGATELVPFPHPDAPTLVSKFPGTISDGDLKALVDSVAWYTKLPWPAPALSGDHIRALFQALPGLMDQFRASVAKDAASAPDAIARMDPRYVQAFKTLDAPAAGLESRGGAGAETRGTPRGARPVPVEGAGAPEGPPKSGPVVARYVVADLPPRIERGAKASLLVSLRALAAGAASAPIGVAVGARIDIVVRAGGAVAIEGESEASLEVSEPQSELPVRLVVRGTREGSGTVQVFAFHAGVAIASLEVPTSVVVPDQDRALVEVVRRVQPDLSMFVFEEDGALTFHLLSADGSLHMRRFGPVSLRGDPREFFRNRFRDIEDLPLQTKEQREIATLKLRSRGAELFAAVLPADLQAILWADHRSERPMIKSVQIASEEPWIPWEVCRLQGVVGGRIEEGPFFAERYAVSRWLVGVPAVPRLRLTDVALVVPEDSGLKAAQEEAAFVESLRRAGRQVTRVKASFLGVTEEMKRGKYDAWHFSGHARASPSGDANEASIELCEREKLTPADVTGEVANVNVPRPLVFLNGCQAAQGGLTLTGIGGWADRFVRGGGAGGAAAFIGTYWAIDDAIASAFARALYPRLLEGQPIGAAVREARLSVKQDGDPTWLAYTVYADPGATVSAP